MDEVDFYLEDLKSKFDKINPKEYQFLYFDASDSAFLYWFIRNYLKNEDIKIIFMLVDKSNFDENKKNIYGFLSNMKTCFDEKGNFFPLHDLNEDLKNKIQEKYIYEQS